MLTSNMHTVWIGAIVSLIGFEHHPLFGNIKNNG